MTLPKFERPGDAPPDPDRDKPKGRTAERKPRAGSKASRRSLETEIGAMLIRLNMFVLITPFARDALDEHEIMALAKDINEQAQRSARFYRMVEIALNGTAGGGLPLTLGIVIGRRLARHNALPIPPDSGITQAQIDDALGSLIVMNAQGAKRVPNMPSVSMPETGNGNGIGAG